MAKPPRYHGPVRSSVRCEELGGLSGVARRLHELHPAVGWPQGARTLYTQLDKLDKGDSVWWRARPARGQALAAVLGLELLDLGLDEASAENHRHVVDLTAFPGMPPLDLRRDAAWRLGAERLDSPGKARVPGGDSLEEWLTPSPARFRPPYNKHWLCVEDDLDRHVLARSLYAAGHYDVVFVPRLSDAEDQLSTGKPLIVVVDIPDADVQADFEALAWRPEGVGLLVIASWVLPAGSDIGSASYFSSWERDALRGRELVAFDLAADASGGIQRWTWARFPDWRTRLLRWLERHFTKSGKDSLFSAGGVLGWLERFDPREEWFHTVSDVLSLCLGFESEKKLPAAQDAKAGHALVAALQRHQPKPLAKPLETLCLARWRSRDMAWMGALPLARWSQLIPRGVETVQSAELDVIAQGKTVKARRQAVQALHERLQVASPQALQQSGLLVAVADGYDFQHRSLAHLLVRDQLLVEMASGVVSEWAWACFDAQRCGLVDAALDALPLPDLETLASHVAGLAPTSLECIGASEAIFHAVGRRIALGTIGVPAEAFWSVARSVVARLDLEEVHCSCPSPWSRSLDCERQKLDWITACWAWSLTARPAWAGDANWLFPGWDEALPAPADWVLSLWPAVGAESLPRGWECVLRIALEWVKEVDAPFPDAPRILQFAYLMKAAAGGWEAQPHWWRGLLHGDNRLWIDGVLLRRFREAGAPEIVAQRLWLSYLAWEAEQPLTGIQACLTYSWQVRRWLLASLPVPWAVDSVEDARRWYLASCPQTLPPSWRGPLLLSLKGRWEEIPPGDEGTFLVRFGPGIANELEQVLGQGLLLGLISSNLIWQWNARRASDLLLGSTVLDAKVWVELFYACPTEHLDVAVHALQMYPDRLAAPDRIAWARQHMPSCGPLAAPLLALCADASAFVTPKG